MGPEPVALLAIVGLILVKEAGVPVPVPGDLIVIGAGVAAGRGGARSVAVARSTPGVRIVAIAASALAGIPAVAFVAGLAIGNALFIGAHFGLGYLLGEPVVTVVGGILGPLAIAGVGLGIVGGVGWIVISRRRGAAADPLTTVAAWADACCPACLALVVAESRR